MANFWAIVVVVCFFGAFALWHGESFIWLFLGVICMAVAIWAGAKLQRADEDEDNPVI